MAVTLAQPRRSPGTIGPSLHSRTHVQLLMGFLVGTGAGTVSNMFIPGSVVVSLVLDYVARPIEQLFLQLLLFVIPPLLCAAILSGIARLRSQRQVRRLLFSTLVMMAVVSAIAALLALAMANLFRPGDAISPDVAQHLITVSQSGYRSSGPIARWPAGLYELSAFSLLSALGQDHLASLVLFALLIGIGLSVMQSRGSTRLLAATDGIFTIGMKFVGIITRFAPIVIGCFVFDVTTVFGWHLLVWLGAYVAVVVAALAIHALIVLSALVWMLGGVQPPVFFRSVQEAVLIAFSTSSSNATLPAALHVAEDRLQLPARIARPVLGVGTVANQAGTAIWIGVSVIFLSQCFGQDLGWGQQAMVFAISSLAGMSTIGVPAGAVPIIAMSLALIGLPPEGIGLIIGVDRLLDMFRTALNVLGDLAIATALAGAGGQAGEGPDAGFDGARAWKGNSSVLEYKDDGSE